MIGNFTGSPEKEPKVKTIYKATIAETAEKAATGKEAENAKSSSVTFLASLNSLQDSSSPSEVMKIFSCHLPWKVFLQPQNSY